VAKKPKHRHHPPQTPDVLRSRIERAMHEGRYQQALELGKQLYKQQPTSPHRDLLQQVYLSRARQLRQQGYTRDARTVLENAVQLGSREPAFLEQLAEELAACGDPRRSLEVLKLVPGSAAQTKVLAQAADFAVQQGKAGREQLPEDLRGQWDLILRAFEQATAGQDEQARENLQGIGLQSPFLEWKLLLRGLMAYYQSDDVRAVENWQRLTPERLPARLAAPLRFQIDASYRAAQPPDVQVFLQKQADRLQTSGLVQPLRTLQSVLADTDQLPSAFRLVEGIVPALRQQAPHLVPRLAACFYWTVVMHGQPEDVGRYQRVFGAPADDPQLARFRALLFEHMFEMEMAHKSWQQFEQSVAGNPAWPGEQANRVRALVWCRMGHNAESVPDISKMPNLPPFLQDFPGRPKPLVPSAEKCFEHSLKLAPDQLEVHEALFHHYQHAEQEVKAEKAARKLLEHYPDHVPTLEALSDLRVRQDDFAEALTLLHRALRVNPLDRRLRSKIGTTHLFKARSHTEAGHFAEARAEYQTALKYRDGKEDSSVYCKWAACEFKAGDTARAEELLQHALREAGNRLAVAYSMLIEVIRLKLPPKSKTRFNKEFNAALNEPPTVQAAVAILDTASVHQEAGITYHGQKTHEKKVLAYLNKARKLEFTEEQLYETCKALLNLKAYKVLRDFTAQGKRRYPQNPYFYFLEAESYFAQGPYHCPAWKVQPLLHRARELAHTLPPDDKRKSLLEEIEQRQQMLGASGLLNPQLMNAFGGMFNQMFGGGPMDDYDDDYDDDEYY
jgi:tetratricopeptide (TPR) repeat protein